MNLHGLSPLEPVINCWDFGVEIDHCLHFAQDGKQAGGWKTLCGKIPMRANVFMFDETELLGIIDCQSCIDSMRELDLQGDGAGRFDPATGAPLDDDLMEF